MNLQQLVNMELDQFTKKIRDEIINLGGVIKLGYEIKNLDFDNSEIRKVYFKNKKPRVINKEDIIISSLPLPLTAKFLGHKSNLKFRGIRSIYISVNKKNITSKNSLDLFWIKKIIFNRVSEPKLMSEFVSPEKKVTFAQKLLIQRMTRLIE